MNNTTYKVLNPFTVISNADETIRFWVPKKQEDGTMIFVAGFDVKAYPLFLDHMSALYYLNTHSISVVDQDMTYIYTQITDDTVEMEKLIYDLSELLNKHEENYDRRNTAYTGTREQTGD